MSISQCTRLTYLQVMVDAWPLSFWNSLPASLCCVSTNSVIPGLTPDTHLPSLRLVALIGDDCAASDVASLLHSALAMQRVIVSNITAAVNLEGLQGICALQASMSEVAFSSQCSVGSHANKTTESMLSINFGMCNSSSGSSSSRGDSSSSRASSSSHVQRPVVHAHGLALVSRGTGGMSLGMFLSQIWGRCWAYECWQYQSQLMHIPYRGSYRQQQTFHHSCCTLLTHSQASALPESMAAA